MFTKEILYAQNEFEAIVACQDNHEVDLRHIISFCLTRRIMQAHLKATQAEAQPKLLKELAIIKSCVL